jgi:small subunit ribosomal protein S8
MTDPISDMLTSIRNGSAALLPVVVLPHSKIKESIAHILKREGYIADCVAEGTTIKKLKLKLKFVGRKGVIDGLRRVSKPGLRNYVASTEIPRIRGGMGTVILSTSQGIMTGQEARKNKMGGEVVCYVW